MRVATAKQMAAIDRRTIEGGVPGPELMERAGREIVRRALDLFPDLAPPASVAVCCGKGNNGGDGLVMARLFSGLGFRVSVMLLALPEDLSDDARLNHGRLPSQVDVLTPPPERWPDRWAQLCQEAELAVDAVFGTGIEPPLRGPYVELLRAFNRQLVPVLSVDIPSGVSGDTGAVDPVAVLADATVTVGLPKLGLLLPPGRDHVGELAVVDIGFTEDAVRAETSDRHWLTAEEYAHLLPDRRSDAHKYSSGTVLALAGSRRFGGAAVLTGLGALRSGAGLITVAVPESLEVPVRVGLPEALVAPLPAGAEGAVAPAARADLDRLLERQRALAAGPGLGDEPGTTRLVADLLTEVELPLVVDADAFTAFGRLDREPRFRSAEVVLTPHPGELSRVIGLSSAEILERRLDLAPELARRWGVTLLLKGSPSLVAAADGRVHLNATGDDSLAHGGTGDVLTGLIGGLLAQGCSGLEAALLGAWLHGRAGELAGLAGSRRSVLAREVADHLPQAYASLEDLLPLAEGGPQRGGAEPDR